MSDLPGHDAWKTDSGREDEPCVFCRADPFWRDGFQPAGCTGECKRRWRDPDDERDRVREERTAPWPF